MSQQKPVGLSWDQFAEHQIQEAIESGAFENLPGFGKPIPGIDGRVDDPNWWVRSKLQREKMKLSIADAEAMLRLK